MIWIVFVIYALLSVTGLLLIKVGTADTSMTIQEGLFNLQTSPKFVIGFIIYICSFLLSIYVIKQMKLSLFYPVATGTILLLTCILSFFILKESIGTFQVVGIVLILCGVVFINIKPV